MKLNEYQDKSARTLNYHNDKNQAIANYSMGIAGESGELIDHLKKHVFHGHELDKEYIKKELGDILWYVAAIASTLEIELDEVASKNIEKLLKRYPENFNHKASIERVV